VVLPQGIPPYSHCDTVGHSPLTRIIVVLPQEFTGPLSLWYESQSPDEDHCGSSPRGNADTRSDGNRHSPLTRIIVVLPVFPTVTPGPAQSVTVP